MNLNTSKKHTAAAVDIDALLQDSFLLVVQLRQGASAHNGKQLKALCVKQVEYVSHSLKEAGLNQRSIDHISHAQCALLDETMLNCVKDDAGAHAQWASEPLQAKFFNRHQAGEFLYEDMREVLREPAPDLQVLTAFQRVLMLGFQGRYRNANDPERLQLAALLPGARSAVHPGQSQARIPRSHPGDCRRPQAECLVAPRKARRRGQGHGTAPARQRRQPADALGG